MQVSAVGIVHQKRKAKMCAYVREPADIRDRTQIIRRRYVNRIGQIPGVSGKYRFQLHRGDRAAADRIQPAVPIRIQPFDIQIQ